MEQRSVWILETLICSQCLTGCEKDRLHMALQTTRKGLMYVERKVDGAHGPHIVEVEVNLLVINVTHAFSNYA